ncbi:hypothetical protein EVAR_32465_1 [Eumeta japonica]|uniref:Uncharacterized protein n=1 Tax=Eumeta variegata TaxID=151549 RepID=A0A4C1VLR9_EUMVA|nr:hypothetical protein EVAR_32465_1 [Eumeta japonica]
MSPSKTIQVFVVEHETRGTSRRCGRTAPPAKTTMKKPPLTNSIRHLGGESVFSAVSQHSRLLFRRSPPRVARADTRVGDAPRAADLQSPMATWLLGVAVDNALVL